MNPVSCPTCGGEASPGCWSTRCKVDSVMTIYKVKSLRFTTGLWRRDCNSGGPGCVCLTIYSDHCKSMETVTQLPPFLLPTDRMQTGCVEQCWAVWAKKYPTKGGATKTRSLTLRLPPKSWSDMREKWAPLLLKPLPSFYVCIYCVCIYTYIYNLL